MKLYERIQYLSNKNGMSQKMLAEKYLVAGSLVLNGKWTFNY